MRYHEVGGMVVFPANERTDIRVDRGVLPPEGGERGSVFDHLFPLRNPLTHPALNRELGAARKRVEQNR